MPEPGREREVSNGEILRAIALHPDPIVTAGEIAERLDMSSAGINKRLPDLIEEDYIRRKEVGARAVVYWLTEDGKKRAAES